MERRLHDIIRSKKYDDLLEINGTTIPRMTLRYILYNLNENIIKHILENNTYGEIDEYIIMWIVENRFDEPDLIDFILSKSIYDDDELILPAVYDLILSKYQKGNKDILTIFPILYYYDMFMDDVKDDIFQGFILEDLNCVKALIETYPTVVIYNETIQSLIDGRRSDILKYLQDDIFQGGFIDASFSDEIEFLLKKTRVNHKLKLYGKYGKKLLDLYEEKLPESYEIGGLSWAEAKGRFSEASKKPIFKKVKDCMTDRYFPKSKSASDQNPLYKAVVGYTVNQLKFIAKGLGYELVDLKNLKKKDLCELIVKHDFN